MRILDHMTSELTLDEVRRIDNDIENLRTTFLSSFKLEAAKLDSKLLDVISEIDRHLYVASCQLTLAKMALEKER